MYGYKFSDGNKMRLNKWGVLGLVRDPVVLFETLGDLYEYTGEDRDNIEIVKFKKLWGFHSNDDGWHSDSTRKFGTQINLFDIKEEATAVCPEGYQVVQYIKNLDTPKKENNMNNSPLKEFLLKGLTPAVEALDWDFDKAKEYTPRSAGELVAQAISDCEFKDTDIFTYIPLELGQDAKFPVNFFCKETSMAFITPKEGTLPEGTIVETDELYVPTFQISNAITMNRDYKRDRRTDVLQRAIQVIAQGFINKIVSEQNKTVAAATHKTAVEQSSTMRALFDMQTQMARINGRSRARITDLYVTPEAYADILDHAQQQDRFFMKPGDVFADVAGKWKYAGTVDVPKSDQLTVCGMRIHVDAERVDEMNDTFYNHYNQDGQKWRPAAETFGKKLVRWLTFGPRTMELVYKHKPLMFGFDLDSRDCFITPFRKNGCEFFNDPSLNRSQKQGIYGWMQVGMAALDNRHVVAGTAEEGELKVADTATVTGRMGLLVSFMLPLKRSGGLKGWIRRWW